MWLFHYHRKLQWRHLRGRHTNVNGWSCQESTPFGIWDDPIFGFDWHWNPPFFTCFLATSLWKIEKIILIYIWKEQQQFLTSSCSFSVSAAGPVRAVSSQARADQVNFHQKCRVTEKQSECGGGREQWDSDKNDKWRKLDNDSLRIGKPGPK